MTSTNQSIASGAAPDPQRHEIAGERTSLFRLRDAAWQPNMDGETALRVLFMPPDRRSRFEFNDPGTVESFAMRRLPNDPAYGFAVVVALARVFVDHRETPDVRIKAAEYLVGREPATGKAMVLALCNHPDEAQRAFAEAQVESLVGNVARSSVFQRVVPHMTTLLFSTIAADRTKALGELARFTREESPLIAAAISALCVEGQDPNARQDGAILLKSKFPETEPYLLPRRAA